MTLNANPAVADLYRAEGKAEIINGKVACPYRRPVGSRDAPAT